MRPTTYNMKRTLVLAFLLLSCTAAAQYYSRYNNSSYVSFDREVYSPASRFHTSIRPLLLSEVNTITNTDSILRSQWIGKPGKHKAWNWIKRKVNNEDFLILDKKDVYISLNPIFDFGGGYDASNSRYTWENSRGFLAEGTIVDQVSFQTGFMEHQSQLVPYIDSIALRTGVIPGMGSYKGFKGDAYDFSESFGYVSYSPSRYFNIKLGYGKNFIGDGHRSMLLGDVPFHYPYLQLSANFWHIKYIALYAQFINREQPYDPDLGYNKKYGTFHYLDWAISKRVNVGIFEAVIWDSGDSSQTRGFDWTYLNPVLFLRPAEFSVGSPDNALLGLNASVKVGRKSYFYGQFLLDEFKLEEILAGDGWYANKWGLQAGFRSFDIFKIPNLSILTEVNIARPFTYSHWNYSNYAHYSQPLAHPAGANFWESVTLLKYHWKRWYVNNEFQYYVYGADTANTNYGGDIFKFYTTKTQEYGNTITQGLQTNVLRNELVLSYLVNPATNMNISAGFVYRNERTDRYQYTTTWFYVAFRTSLWNRNWDI